jgi:hypothetical protein
MKLMSFNKPELTDYIRALTKSMQSNVLKIEKCNYYRHFLQITHHFQIELTGLVVMTETGRENISGVLQMILMSLT